MILQTTLSLAAAAAIINLWLSIRVGALRRANGLSHGDGGIPAIAQRMRAHLNFAENAPLVLILIAAIELTGKGGQWLAIAGAVFMLARVVHPIGMDKASGSPLRAVGAVVTLLTQLGLAVVAVLIALGRI